MRKAKQKLRDMQKANKKESVDKFDYIKADLNDDAVIKNKGKKAAKGKAKTAQNKKRKDKEDSIDDFIVSDDEGAFSTGRAKGKGAKTAKR